MSVRRWTILALFVACAAVAARAIDAADNPFKPLFNGRNLEGWEGDTELWQVKDGEIVGTSMGLSYNDFLATADPYGDFVLKLRFKIDGDETANSGVMFRAKRVPDSKEMSGYQADIGQEYWGCLYDESRRNKTLVQAAEDALKTVRRDGWNEYEIRAEGARITLKLNGVKSVEYLEPDGEIPREGRIALQIHQGHALTVHFKDIEIQPLSGIRAK